MKRNHALLLTCAAIIMPMQAYAQTSGATGSTQGAARAADAGEKDATADIIVTAQYRASNLQDTPLAIAAVTGEALTARGLTDVKSLATVSPSVTLAQSAGIYGKSVFAYIRGVGVGDYDPAFDPAVGFYVDDIYYGSLVGTTFDLLDLERVEVLRGPQGTLFGKNTIGGAIRLISKKPDGTLGGYGEATYGSFNRFDVRAGINIPIIGDDLAVRLSAVHKEQEGYVRRYDFVCAHPTLSGTLPGVGGTAANNCMIGRDSGENVDAFRVAVRAKPSSSLTIDLVGDYSIDHSDPGAMIMTGTAPTPADASLSIPFFGIPLDNRFICGKFCNYSTYGNPYTGQYLNPKNRTENYGFSGTISYDIADDLKLAAITGYRSVDVVFISDSDASPLDNGVGRTPIKNKQFSQELRLQGSSFNSFLDWVVGGYYYRSKSTFLPFQDLPTASLQVTAATRVKITDYSGFVHLTGHLTDKLNLIVGARYTHEEKVGHVNQSFACYLPGAVIFPGCIPTVDTFSTQKYNRVDPKVSLDYHVTDEVMLYGQFATGFRGGGLNDRPFTPNQVFLIKPEKLTSYEAGIKSRFFDRKLTFNLTAFQSDYTDIQLLVSGLDNQNTPFFSYLNAGDARIRGLELETGLKLGGLSLSLNGSYLDAKITRSQAPTGFLLSPGALPAKGNRLPYAPELKFSAGAQYVASLGDLGSLTPRIDVTYQTSQFTFDTSNRPNTKVESYAVVDGRLTWALEDKGLSIAAGVTNLFNKYYYVAQVDAISAGIGVNTAVPGRPREYSVTVRKTF